MSESQESSPVYDWPKIFGHKKDDERREFEKVETTSKACNIVVANNTESVDCEDPIPLISNAIAASFREQLGK